MKKLNINITKATLQSYSVTLEEGKPTVSATVALLTEAGKAITTYSVSTNSWREQDKFDLPVTAIPPIVELAEILERIVSAHCRDSQLGISAGEAVVVNE